jgi:hypothetical protein
MDPAIRIVALFLSSAMLSQAQEWPARTQLGVAHIGGLYAFSKTDHLNEGAAAAFSIGARCIKVGLSLDTDKPSPKLYPFNSRSPVCDLFRQ